MDPAAPLREEVLPLSVEARPELTGGRRVGVLLIHGFTGSPASMNPWGRTLAEHGYAVEVPLLPGHGTTWQDLNTKRFEDWYGEVQRSFEKLSAENDAVVVGGLSMGGTLALRLAADVGDRVAGLVLVNAAVRTTRKDVLALPVLKWLVGSFPGLSNDIALEGVEEHSYDRTPLKAIHSLMQAWKPLRADLHRISVPILFFKSDVDHVVDPSSHLMIRERVSSTDFTDRALARSYHVATVDHDAEIIHAESADFIARVTQEQVALP